MCAHTSHSHLHTQIHTCMQTEKIGMQDPYKENEREPKGQSFRNEIYKERKNRKPERGRISKRKGKIR